MGGTLAYWNWQSSSEQKTNVTFTVASGFSCSADGGGSINNNTGTLAPAHCDNANYAFKRTIRANVTNNRESSIYLDMWLNVNSIDTNLANSENFRYALTTGSTDCNDGLVFSGNFLGATNGTQVPLFGGKEYATTTNNDTYYLWVWLDSAETSPDTMNQNFSLSLGGECTDQRRPFTGTIYRNSTEKISIGDSIVPETEQALCIVGGDYNSCEDDNWGYELDQETECNDGLQNVEDGENTYTCQQGTVLISGLTNYETNPSNINSNTYLKHTVVNNIVTESYVGFVVTPAMVLANSGMTAGTYYWRGLDTHDEYDNCKSQYLNNGYCISPYYESNKTVMQSAFGASSGYCHDYSFYFYCNVSGLFATAEQSGYVSGSDSADSGCSIFQDGDAYCSR